MNLLEIFDETKSTDNFFLRMNEVGRNSGGNRYDVDGYRVSFDGVGSTVFIHLIIGHGGNATEVMNKIIGVAKQTGIKLQLFAKPMSPLSNDRKTRRRLVNWYERCGFVAVRGTKRRNSFISQGEDSLHMELV